MLTGKCKEDFEYKFNMSNFNELDDTLKNARYIEFFDSSGIYIIITVDFNFCYKIYQDGKLTEPLCYDIDFSERRDATMQAIKKTNEIYNHLNKD